MFLCVFQILRNQKCSFFYRLPIRSVVEVAFERLRWFLWPEEVGSTSLGLSGLQSVYPLVFVLKHWQKFGTRPESEPEGVGTRNSEGRTSLGLSGLQPVYPLVFELKQWQKFSTQWESELIYRWSSLFIEKQMAKLQGVRAVWATENKNFSVIKASWTIM